MIDWDEAKEDVAGMVQVVEVLLDTAPRSDGLILKATYEDYPPRIEITAACELHDLRHAEVHEPGMGFVRRHMPDELAIRASEIVTEIGETMGLRIFHPRRGPGVLTYQLRPDYRKEYSDDIDS